MERVKDLGEESRVEGGLIPALLGLGQGVAGLQETRGAHGVSTPSSSLSWPVESWGPGPPPGGYSEL